MRSPAVGLLALAIVLTPAAAMATVELELTVAPSSGDPETDGGLCGEADSLTVSPGDDVVYCYTLRNTGASTYDSHSLSDTVLGSILFNFPYTLAPGASVFVTQVATITASVTNTAIWSVSGPGGQAADSDTATVEIGAAAIELRITVAPSSGDVETDGGLCGPTDSISVAAGTAVVFCYSIENTGEVRLGTHDLTSDLLGAVLSGFPFELAPGGSVFLTQVTLPLASSTVETAVWTARNAVNPEVEAASGDSATVQVPEPGATAAGVAAALALFLLARGRGRRPRFGTDARSHTMAVLAVLALVASCGRGADRGADLSAPIIHIGANVDDPRVMETAILVVIHAPFATVRDYVSDPANVRHYLAFVTDSTAEPLAGGAEGEQRLSLRMSVADVFGVSVSGMPMTLSWRPVPAGEGVLAVAFERIEGAYEQMSGSIYAMDLADGSTAAMLRVTSRSGFVPEAVRERLARWHAEESLRKLARLLESARSS